MKIYSSMSFNGQARSGSITWRRMLCSRCIPADLLPGSVLTGTVNIEILRVTNIAGTGTITVAVDPELR